MKVFRYLEQQIGNGKISQNELLKNHTTFKIGGCAEYFCTAENILELIKIIKIVREIGLEFHIIGSGSNILVSDQGLKGLTIHNVTNQIIVVKRLGKIVNWKTQVRQVLVQADSGVLINQLVRYTCDFGFAGLERHLGLPGTVGGAIYTNSKWSNPLIYVGSNLYSAEILDQKNIIKTVKQNYFAFGYDQSILQKTQDILLKAVFLLTVDKKHNLWNIAQNSIAYRMKSQPMGVASAGCIFKNISLSDAIRINTPNHTQSAGYLLDQAGLKNYAVGGAYFSNKHANFIINSGNAKAEDVKKLIDYAKDIIKTKYDIDLEVEIYLLGEFS